MAGTAVFTVTLSAISSDTVTVDYTTVDGTAVAPTDYTAASGTLTFNPGDTTKTVTVTVQTVSSGSKAFTLQLSNPSHATLASGGGSGTATLTGASSTEYLDRFNWVYTHVHNTANGYYGPPTGSLAHQVPYHCPELIVAEAPDWGHETVSETGSFAVGLEAWKGLLSGDWTGYTGIWNIIDTVYVPNSANQPWGSYTASSPATYSPEQDTPQGYPVLGDSNAAVGTDGLYQELQTTYGTKNMYLMHWIIDVDGIYGYHNGDTTTSNVYINSYQRGLQESCFETVTFPCWEDYSFGMPQYGYLPLYGQSLPLYPAAQFNYSKQWRYTCAPDAEGRAIQWAYRANQWAATNNGTTTISSCNTKAKKMGDYLRYALFDKYFRQIGANRTQGSTSQNPYTACHYLTSWYVAWGGEVPTAPATASWGFRIGSSESHQGYQTPNIAYYMATGGGGYTPQSASAGDIWLGAMYRQIEMLRWLQSPEGPLAGGVTNSWLGRYLTPTDGRQTHTFYGMYYTYAPVWHDPPSNNWFGFQCWGLQRLADLFLEVSDKNTSVANAVRPNCEIILNKFVNYVLNQVQLVSTDDFSLPDTLSWVSNTQVSGQTTTSANLEGVYEYLPSLTWDGTGDYGAFWNESTVPNPNLHCSIAVRGNDLGVASSLALLLILFAQAKRNMNKFTTALTGSSHTPEDAFNLAKELLDRIWNGPHRDTKGIAHPEQRGDYKRMGDTIYIPSNFVGAHMANNDPITPGSATFTSIRSFITHQSDWPQIAAYIADPVNAPAPTFTYHRYWANAEYAMACGAMHHYFGDIVYA